MHISMDWSYEHTQVLATYFYKDIDGLAEVSDYPGGFVVIKSNFGRMHLFARYLTLCNRIHIIR